MNQKIENWKAQTPFPVEFLHNGGRWALTIYAVDEEDAQKKVESLRQSATLIGGPIVETIDVS